MPRRVKAWALLVSLLMCSAPSILTLAARPSGPKSCCASAACCAHGQCPMRARPAPKLAAKHDSCHMGAQKKNPEPAPVCTCAFSSQDFLLDFTHADLRFDLPHSRISFDVPSARALSIFMTAHALAGFGSPSEQPPEKIA